MTHEEKIRYLDLACRLVGFGFKHRDLDLLITLYDDLLVKGGRFSVHDAAEIQVAVDERERARTVADAEQALAPKFDKEKKK